MADERPRQRQAAAAFGPGFAKEADSSTPNQPLLDAGRDAGAL